MTTFTNKVALITGGTKGIGRAIAEKFAQLDIKLVINYASDQQSAKDMTPEDYYFIPGLLRAEDNGYLTPVFFEEDLLVYYNNRICVPA